MTDYTFKPRDDVLTLSNYASEKERINALENEIRLLRLDLLTQAKLASDGPEFDNPFHVWFAESMRDYILDNSNFYRGKS